jgi:membrane-associated phospholipid phosphatase
MVRIYLVINLLVILLISQTSFSFGYMDFFNKDSNFVISKDSNFVINKDSTILNKDSTVTDKKDTILLNNKDSSIIVKKDTTVFVKIGLDLKLFRVFNNYRYGLANTIIPITDKSVLPVSILLPLSLAAFSRVNSNYYDENSGLLLAVSEITSTGITLGIKQLFQRGRPFETLDSVYENRFNSPTDKYAFPSGHTTIAFSIATALTLRYPDKPFLIAGSYLYAAIVGYGRIYLGVHYPLDVLGGVVVGCGTSILVYSLRKEIINIKNNLFKEGNRPDSNNAKELSTPLILGLTVGVDLLNSFIQNSSFKNNVVISSGQNELTAKIYF